MLLSGSFSYEKGELIMTAKENYRLTLVEHRNTGVVPIRGGEGYEAHNRSI